MTPVLNNGKNKSDLQVFRRWSRKSYAAFASMNKEIKISCINTSYNLLVPSKECGFSGFCFIPENRWDKNETDELDPLSSEIIQMLVVQNESKRTNNQIESRGPNQKVLSAHLQSRFNNEQLPLTIKKEPYL